jgi:ferredoxin-like protein FixX
MHFMLQHDSLRLGQETHIQPMGVGYMGKIDGWKCYASCPSRIEQHDKQRMHLHDDQCLESKIRVQIEHRIENNQYTDGYNMGHTCFAGCQKDNQRERGVPLGHIADTIGDWGIVLQKHQQAAHTVSTQ